jgi:two-component system chemotaxis sensor kinase CheA
VVLDHVRHAAATWPAGEATETSPAPEPTAPRGTHQHDQRTMRVPESHIDAFLQHVGELLVVRDMFDHLRQRMARGEEVEELMAGFRRANETFATLAGELQRSIMSIRLVPMKNLLQKAPRLVRDIAQSEGKRIDVQLIGEDLELDKSLTDLLDAPLTHMVRNAADHGIESEEQRRTAGKPETGTIGVAAELVGEQVVLSIEDDGAGLDYEALHRKAESLGMIPAGKTLSESEMIDLLFCSGVSTAKVVTDISGRGVGMDVVKQAIEQAGGSIHVTSERGQGSRFEIRLPKAVITQIMPGYVVKIDGQRYVLPLNRVRDATALEGQQVDTVAGRGRCVRRHDRVVPVLSVRQALGGGTADAGGQTLVALEANRREVLAEVDEALGIQQVVLRQIVGIGDAGGLVRGGALMGDGAVALVLDPDALDVA